jgi:protein SCO1/2
MASMTSKRLLLGVLLVLPVAMYLGSLVISGAVNFRSLEDLGDPLAKANWSDSIQFTRSDEQLWTVDSLDGKIAVVSFFFTSCPTICPAMNFHLKEAHDRLYGFKDLIFISCTVDPQTDVPVVLHAYKERLGVDGSNKWDFITGQREDLYALANAYYLVAMQDSSAAGGYTHSQSAVILDWNGHLRSRITDDGNLLGVYDVSEPYLVDQLVEDVRVLVKEHRKIKMGQ